ISNIKQTEYESNSDWTNERKDNEDRMAINTADKMARGNIPVSRKWILLCMQLQPNDVSQYFDDIMYLFHIEKIKKVFDIKRLNSEFIKDQYELKKIKHLYEKDSKKSEFLSALFLNAMINSGTIKNASKYDIDE
ncbi:hypothetical protein, partial [Enterococcus gallinarum]